MSGGVLGDEPADEVAEVGEPDTEQVEQNKMPALFSYLSNPNPSKRKKTSGTPSAQYTGYLEHISTADVPGGIQLWNVPDNQSKYPVIIKLPCLVLSVPASSAPIE